jgi:hypothetical protein
MERAQQELDKGQSEDAGSAMNEAAGALKQAAEHGRVGIVSFEKTRFAAWGGKPGRD